MITVTTNIGSVAQNLVARFKQMSAQVNDRLIRTIATDALAEIKNRIHSQGEKADESQIGTYTNPYLKRRQKKPYNRTGDTKIIFSLTRNMETQFSVIATPKGYGLGWLDSGGGSGLSKGKVSNFDKANFLEQRFGKVYSLTSKEKEQVKKTTEEFLKQSLNTK